MVRIMLALWFTLLFPFLAAAQEKKISSLKFTEERKIKGNFQLLDVDALGNIYVITRDFQLRKYNAAGDSFSVWNDVKAFGNPTLLDVSNPLRILIYYKGFTTVVILDRFLAFRHSINLRSQGIFRVTAVVNSYDNNIWIFDEQDCKIKKLNDEGNILFETADWRQLFDVLPSPERIIDHENNIFVFDPAKGLYVFDYYGSLRKKIETGTWRFPGKNGRFIYGFSDDSLSTLELPGFTQSTYPVPFRMNELLFIKLMNDKVYLLDKNGISIHKIENSGQ